MDYSEIAAFTSLIISLVGIVGGWIWGSAKGREIENLKHKNQQEAFVHQLQFEKEFEIYYEIWTKLTVLKTISIMLRNEGERAPRDEDKYIEHKKKLLEEMTLSGLTFVDSFEKNKPFYTSVIYSKLREVNDLMGKEGLQLRFRIQRMKGGYLPPKWDEKYWEDAKENFDKIETKCDELCEAIRDRIIIN